MIQFIYTLNPKLLKTLRFVIVEPFVVNQVMQKKYFEEAFGDAIELLHVTSLEEFTCKEAFFVANEIFDAFSCEVIYANQMLFIEETKAFFAPMDSFTCKKAEAYGVRKGELCLGYEAFAKAMAKSAERFEFITFDYGDKEAREDFSLRVYEKHQTYPFFGLTELVDENLREALSLAIDRQELVDILYFGQGKVCSGPFLPGTGAFNEEVPVPKQDIAKAKALLKEAGYDEKNPFTFELSTSASGSGS